MIPANQRFGADDFPGPHVHLGLIEQAEFVAFESLLDGFELQPMLLHSQVMLGVEQVVAVATRLLGLIHRLVGVPQQGVGIGVVQRVDGNAAAGADGYALAVEQIGL
ncbi:hypothetical protein GALL_392120 [mine drainage metagenome]|uniref:Uncharacterized protein n=1 Tax=mine drainage metagenome TaxID=410659 RepID=A0A1J5Q5X6_9ZZZZ